MGQCTLRRTLFVATTAAALAAKLVNAQTAPDYCKVFLEKPIFTTATTTSSATQRENFRLLACSSSFKSAAEAQSAGIEATIPIYDLPVPFTASWDNQKVETWKSANCTAEERAGSASMAYYNASYAVSPVSANAALACYVELFKAMGNEALRCELTETSNSYVFNARWRRTAGEAGPGPKVTQFTVLNTQCLNAAALGDGTFVSEGGIPVLCTVGKDAAAFALTTDRGGCSASGRYRAPKLIMPATLVLSAPFTQVADEMEFPSGASVVTNGYPFSISASRLVLQGPVSVKSFESISAGPGTPGMSASTVSVVAKELVGVGGLTILNAGQAGGKGATGAAGPPGNPGKPGVGRTTSWSNVCKNFPWPLSQVCELQPTGCEGGEDGAPGGAGIAGYPGNPGLAGGAGGPVFIDVDPSGRNLVTVLTDTGVDGRPMACNGAVCGGPGGPGGDGGAGGPGGPGGQGASGTAWCGGTNAGQRGTDGATGTTGPTGPAGSPVAPRG